MPQADLQSFLMLLCEQGRNKKQKARDGLRAKPSPQHTGLCASWMRGWGKWELCCFGKGMVWCPLHLLLGGEESPFSKRMVLRGILSLGLFSSCAVPSCVPLKALGACKTYLDTIMCKERLSICFCGQLKACGFAPVLIFPHQQSKCSLLTVVVAFTKQFCHMKETETKKNVSRGWSSYTLKDELSCCPHSPEQTKEDKQLSFVSETTSPSF